MGRGLQRVAELCGGFKVISGDDSVIYGPNTDDNLTTSGLFNGQEIRIISGRHPFRGRVVRVLDQEIALITREFPTSGKWSKPYKAHISAIEPSDPTLDPAVAQVPPTTPA